MVDAPVPQYAGAAFIAQFVTSLAAGLVPGALLSAHGAGLLADVSACAQRIRTTILLELATSIGTLALTSMLHLSLRHVSRPLALWAFVLRVAEAIVLAVSRLGLYAPFDRAATSYGTGLAGRAAMRNLAIGFHDHAGDVAMLSFCVGALLWCRLMLRDRFVPKWMSVWGPAAVALVAAGTLMIWWNHSLDAMIWLYAACVPFEFVTGAWLVVKGAPAPRSVASHR